MQPARKGRIEMENIVLIGMPGCGKSTVGVKLAQALDMSFIDTDDVIKARSGRKLQDMVDHDGIDRFLEEEADAVCSLHVSGYVIATGGSVVYRERAMRHLHALGTVLYLALPYEEIERRIHNLSSRGIALREGQTLRMLYDERIPLYEAQADVVVDAQGLETEETVQAAVRACCEMRQSMV